MVPKPNDFTDMAEYFVRKVRLFATVLAATANVFTIKALITALSQIRIVSGETIPLIRTALNDQLRLNDNSSNNVRSTSF